MGSRPLYIGFSRRLIAYIALLLLATGAPVVGSVLRPALVSAAAGVNQQVNFQGRLLNSQGATVADGFYNIQFKIYQDGDGQSVGNTTGSPAGTLKWTESYLNAASQGVTVKNGFLSVQLGSINAFGSSVDWNQDTLWLSMNIASTNGACTPFASCSPDGEMTPMKRLSSTPYALNAGMLGGLTSAGFIQNTSTPQTANFSITGNGTIGGNILVAGSYNTNTFSANNLTFGDNFNPASIISGSGQALNLTGNAASSISTSAGSLSLSAAATQSILIGTTNNNTITLGTTTATSTITVGRSSGSNTVSIASGNTSNGNTQTVNIATGTPTGTGNAQVNIGNTGSASAVNIYAGTGNINLNGNVALGSAKTLTATGNISTTTSVTGGTLASTTATGTAPITVNSTTKVTNLNADLLDGLDSAAFAAASGSTNYIQNGTTQQTANFNIISAAAGSVGAVIQGASGQSVDILQVKDGGGNVMTKLNASGGLTASGTSSVFAALTPPLASGFTLSTVGVAGGATYSYRVTSVNASGETQPNAAVTIATGNTSLSAANFVRITWSAVQGASSYNIYGRSGGGELFMASVTGTGAATYSYDDQGSVTPSGALPAGVVPGIALRVTGPNSPLGPLFDISKYNSTYTSLQSVFSVGQNGATATTLVLNNQVSPTTSLIRATNTLGTTIGGFIQGATAQSANLFEYRDSNGLVNSSFNGPGNQLTLGRISASGTVTQGQLLLSDGTTSNFGTTLKSATLTTGSQTILLPDTGGAGGTICLQNSANCGFLTGSTSSYIQNTTSQQASSNFNVSGTGTAATSIVTPLLDTATAVPLNIGTGTASAVNIAKPGVTTAVGGALTAGSTINNATISGGSLSSSAVNGLNVSSTAVAVSAIATNFSVDAGTTGTVSIGGVSIGNVLLGGGSGATGCTVNNGNGNFDCTGTINGAALSGGSLSGGTVSGGTLTATAVNSLLLGANAVATATGNLTVDANGAGTVSLGGTSTGNVLLGGGSGATGCTVINASGNFACTGTLNGATIVGGTLTSGSYSGATITGGTMSAGNISGGTISGGSLTASTVNGLGVSANNITTAAGALAIDATTVSTISLGGTSTGDILFGGGSGATGCTVTNSTGNFACTGAINGATISGGSFTGGSVSAGTLSGGTVSGGTLTATAVNLLNVGGNTISTASGSLAIDANGTNTVSIGSTSTGNILLGGGSGATGCTVNNGNGNLVCDGSLNGTTLSGGTLSGGVVSGGTLTATAVNSLLVGANAIATSSGNLTVDAAGTGTLSLGSTSTGDILLGGGSGATGCTVINASGNFVCTGTLNGATISGGTLSAGSFTGGAVSGGTLSAGTFSGGSVSGGSLTATAVNSLNLGANAISTASGAFAIDANGANIISIGSGSTGDILLAGGSAGTGCTIANATGNLVCTGTINGATLSGGTLNGGTFSGGSVTSGSYAGATVTGGTLSASAVNGLNVSSTAVAVATAATNLTVDAGTTGTISLGATSTGNVLFAGGLGATGCTVNNGNGNFNCDGTLNGATISGGTLSGGSVTGGTLTATTVNTLIVGANAIATASGNLALDAFGTGTVNIGASSTGDVTLAGGSGATGCTVINASGNFACTGTINGATISGGTLTSGSYSGATITGGTLSAGTFSGGSVSGGSLTATTANGLNVSSSGISTASGNLTLDANGTGTVSVGGASTGDVLLAGGSGAFGCTVANATGNMACTGTITGTTLNGTTGINTGAGAGTQRIDSSGNIVNLGNVTTSGASLFATTGATGFSFKPGTDNATAFQVQNAGGTSIMVVDSSARQLKIFENNGSTNYALVYYDTATTTANYTASAGTVAVGTGAGAISVVSGASSAITITANAASTWKTASGTLTLQSGTASDLILNAGSSIVSVNGSSVIKLGSSAGDPAACTVGAIVYNSTTNLFRGCQGSIPAWATLGTITPTLQNTYTASTGGSTAEIKADATRGGVDIQDADTTTSNILFAVRGSNVAGLGTSLFNVSSNNNTVNVGVADTSSTLLVLDTDSDATYNAGTTSNAGTVVNGAMFYSSSDHNFLCGTAGKWIACNGLLYSNTAASTAVSTCTNTCAAFSTNNSATVPANYCQAGRTIRVLANGVYSTVAATAPTLQFGIYYGTDPTTRANDTLIGSASGTLATGTGATNLGWSVDFTAVCFSTTSMNGQGSATIATSATASGIGLMYTNAATTGLATNTAKNFYLFPTWQTSAAGNTVTAQQLVISGQ